MTSQRSAEKEISDILKEQEGHRYPIAEDIFEMPVSSCGFGRHSMILSGILSILPIVLLILGLCLGHQGYFVFAFVFSIFPFAFLVSFISIIRKRILDAYYYLEFTQQGISIHYGKIQKLVPYNAIDRVLIRNKYKTRSCVRGTKYWSNESLCYVAHRIVATYCDAQKKKLFSITLNDLFYQNRYDHFDQTLDDLLLAGPVRALCRWLSPAGTFTYTGHGGYYRFKNAHGPQLLLPVYYPMDYAIYCNGIEVARLFDGELLLCNPPDRKTQLPKKLRTLDMPSHWSNWISVDYRMYFYNPQPRNWKRVPIDTDDEVLVQSVRILVEAWGGKAKRRNSRSK